MYTHAVYIPYFILLKHRELKNLYQIQTLQKDIMGSLLPHAPEQK
jgi:hypothetical protein